MRMQGRAMRAVLTTGLVALAAFGCTGSPTPEPTTSATPDRSAPPSPSATPTSAPTQGMTAPPERPDAMATPNADGAAAAASYFISLFPYVHATGDFTEWDALSAPGCQFCSGVRSDVVEVRGRGNRTLSSAEVLSASGLEIEANRWYSATLHVSIGPSTEVDPQDAPVREHPAEDRAIDVVMTWSDGWQIDEIGPAATTES
ncbi:DUF6318 family protein [Cellulomonas sp. HD19AZ1]|uniref:DUF6318 family protein n=1 Tax=Cellulomonas sp. HD19AZ1 TaxID=2559593 RepID=UPI0010712BE1|nr:DUF6318 family protein [Cellulomonas sp. HD19AZ1]TFH72170.1 hypothetical protein E4A51_08705 [Cellulomonas sp. HD19AZ1]